MRSPAHRDWSKLCSGTVRRSTSPRRSPSLKSRFTLHGLRRRFWSRRNKREELIGRDLVAAGAKGAKPMAYIFRENELTSLIEAKQARAGIFLLKKDLGKKDDLFPR